MRRVIRRVGYSPGVILDSRQSRNLIGSQFTSSVTVGSNFCIPDTQPHIAFITDYIGNHLIIDRVFWLDINTQSDWCPLYIRIIPRASKEEASILVCRYGITNLLRMYEDADKKEFLRSIMLEYVNDELKVHHPDLAIDFTDRYFISPVEVGINNNYIEYLPGISTSDYPWNVVSELSPDLQVYRENYIMQPNYCASRLIDAYYQVIPDQYGMNNNHMENLFREFIEPVYPTMYNHLAYDNLTTLMATESSLPYKGISRYALTQGDTLDIPIFVPKQPQTYEKVTTFSSSILQYANWVHNLPYTELIGKYILPSREQHTLEKLEVYYSSGNVIPVELYEQFRRSIETITRYWDTDIKEILFCKTRYDELYLRFVYPNKELRYYIDMSMAVVLSQILATIN